MGNPKRRQTNKYILVATVVGVVQILLIAASMFFQAYANNKLFSQIEFIQENYDIENMVEIGKLRSYINICQVISVVVILIAILILWFDIELLHKFHSDMTRQEHTAGCTDELTGLLNRKYIEKYLPKYINKSGQGYLFMCDMDNFKTINDTLGHNVGDEVLVDFAKILKQILRPKDRVCRLGGDEFMLFIPNIDEEGANAVYLRLKDTLMCTFAGTKKNIVTLSCGAALINPKISFNENYQRADQALYYVKESGKNNFCILK